MAHPHEVHVVEHHHRGVVRVMSVDGPEQSVLAAVEDFRAAWEFREQFYAENEPMWKRVGLEPRFLPDWFQHLEHG